MNHLVVVSPAAEAWSKVATIAEGREELRGTRVAIVNNGWSSMEILSPIIGSGLREEFEVAEIREWQVPYGEAAPDELFEEMIAVSDVAVVGLAN